MQDFAMSAEGLALTKRFEGLRLQAYRDVGGVWTIGYGHTGPDLLEGMTITEAEADALLVHDMATSVACVNRHLLAKVSQGQFDAMADFTFNCGVGNFVLSTLLKKVNLGLFAEAAAQFGLWVHVGGHVVEGLVRRRAAEAALFRGGLA